jgi:hypothetical protein
MMSYYRTHSPRATLYGWFDLIRSFGRYAVVHRCSSRTWVAVTNFSANSSFIPKTEECIQSEPQITVSELEVSARKGKQEMQK